MVNNLAKRVLNPNYELRVSKETAENHMFTLLGFFKHLKEETPAYLRTEQAIRKLRDMTQSYKKKKDIGMTGRRESYQPPIGRPEHTYYWR